MLHPVVFLGVFAACYCQTLMLLEPVLTLPSGNDPPAQVTIFHCGIVGSATDFNFTWTTPTGDTITATQFGVAVLVMNNKYLLQIGMMLGIPGFPEQGATFSVMRLLYSDAGEYTCSVTFSNKTTASASVQLILNVFVSILGGGEMATVDAGEVYSVGCEMFGYIREDSDLLWMKDSVTVVEDERISITVESGLPRRGQFGGTDLTSSRVSTLTLRSVEESDGGVYTCFVARTIVRDSISLSVIPTESPPPLDTTKTDAHPNTVNPVQAITSDLPSTNSSLNTTTGPNTVSTVQAIGAALGITSTITIAAIVFAVIVLIYSKYRIHTKPSGEDRAELPLSVVSKESQDKGLVEGDPIYMEIAEPEGVSGPSCEDRIIVDVNEAYSNSIVTQQNTAYQSHEVGMERNGQSTEDYEIV